MDIGQLINMKYRVMTSKKTDQRSIIAIGSVVAVNKAFSIKTIDKTIPPANAITRGKCFGKESLRDLPLELNKPYSLRKVTPWACVTMKGTPKIAKPKKAYSISLILLKYSLKIKNTVINAQNIIFQKLFLLSLDVTKFIMSTILMFKYKTTSFSLTIFRLARKLMVVFSLILAVNAPVYSSFAEDIGQLIRKTEQEYDIPSGLLSAIVSVESGHKPYALNFAGKSIIAKTLEEAAFLVRQYLDQGNTNIDLGVAQINLHWHGENFRSIEDMLDPKNNLAYAAMFLKNLYKQHSSWNKAVRHYHSAKPKHNAKYARKIVVAWLK